MAVTFKLAASGVTMKQLSERLQVAEQQAVRVGGEQIMAVAVERAPIEFGFLRSTGAVIEASQGQYGSETKDEAGKTVYGYEAGAEVQLTFTAPYAVVQHERLDFHHPRGGQAKYLESAMHEFASKLPAIYKRVVELVLKGENVVAHQTRAFLTKTTTTTVYDFLRRTKTRIVETIRTRTAGVGTRTPKTKTEVTKFPPLGGS